MITIFDSNILYQNYASITNERAGNRYLTWALGSTEQNCARVSNLDFDNGMGCNRS